MKSYFSVIEAGWEADVMANKHNQEIYVFELKEDVVIDGETFEKGFRIATEKAWKESWSKFKVLHIHRPRTIVSSYQMF